MSPLLALFTAEKERRSQEKPKSHWYEETKKSRGQKTLELFKIIESAQNVVCEIMKFKIKAEQV